MDSENGQFSKTWPTNGSVSCWSLPSTVHRTGHSAVDTSEPNRPKKKTIFPIFLWSGLSVGIFNQNVMGRIFADFLSYGKECKDNEEKL
jgi:hypothetical protein